MEWLELALPTTPTTMAANTVVQFNSKHQILKKTLIIISAAALIYFKLWGGD